MLITRTYIHWYTDQPLKMWFSNSGDFSITKIWPKNSFFSNIWIRESNNTFLIYYVRLPTTLSAYRTCEKILYFEKICEKENNALHIGFKILSKIMRIVLFANYFVCTFTSHIGKLLYFRKIVYWFRCSHVWDCYIDKAKRLQISTIYYRCFTKDILRRVSTMKYSSQYDSITLWVQDRHHKMQEACNNCFDSKIRCTTLLQAKFNIAVTFRHSCLPVFDWRRVVQRIFDSKQLLQASCILWCYFFKVIFNHTK